MKSKVMTFLKTFFFRNAKSSISIQPAPLIQWGKSLGTMRDTSSGFASLFERESELAAARLGIDSHGVVHLENYADSNGVFHLQSYAATLRLQARETGDEGLIEMSRRLDAGY